MIRDIKRSPIPEGMRITIEMDAETTFRAERLENPRRVFFDLKGTRPVPSLLDATLRFNDDIVREIRLGRHPQTTTRIVFDMAGVDSYSVFTLYSPYRLVIDFKPDGHGRTRSRATDEHGHTQSGATEEHGRTRSGATDEHGNAASGRVSKWDQWSERSATMPRATVDRVPALAVHASGAAAGIHRGAAVAGA